MRVFRHRFKPIVRSYRIHRYHLRPFESFDTPERHGGSSVEGNGHKFRPWGSAEATAPPLNWCCVGLSNMAVYAGDVFSCVGPSGGGGYGDPLEPTPRRCDRTRSTAVCHANVSARLFPLPASWSIGLGQTGFEQPPSDGGRPRRLPISKERLERRLRPDIAIRRGAVRQVAETRRKARHDECTIAGQGDIRVYPGNTPRSTTPSGPEQRDPDEDRYR